MGEFADECFDIGFNNHLDNLFDFNDGDDSDEYINDNVVLVKSNYGKDINCIDKLQQGTDYLLRNFKVSINIVVKCVRITEKAVLFEISADFEDRHAGKQFWIPKSIIHVDEAERKNLPNSKVYYIPDWATIHFIN